MTKKTSVILLFFICFSFTKIYAGWYECYNFKGTIDKYPITLSIQVRQGYFGEQEKRDFNVIGVYKYDKYNTPIRLEGKINFKNNKALLYEISNNKYSAIFEFDFSKSKISGIWKNLSTNKRLILHLDFVSQLIDTTDKNEYSNIEILQTNSLSDFYFVGNYSKLEEDRRAQMNSLKIIQKRDNKIFQTIDFSEIESQTGNVKTIIYDNVEVVNTKTRKIIIWNNIGRVGGYMIVTYDKKTNKFNLNPEPIIDGPN